MTIHTTDADPSRVTHRWTYDDNAQPATIVKTIRVATGEVISSELVSGFRCGCPIELGAA